MSLKLTDRIAWSIAGIKSDFDRGITNVDLAKKLGTNKDTLAGYAHEKGLLKGEVIEKIVELYGFSPTWLLTGQGEPFPGARAKYPDVCGPEGPQYAAPHMEPPVVTETHSTYLPIADDLTKTARVLESETAYATALHMNILSFHQALNMEESCDKVLKQQDALKKRMDELSGEVLILQGQLLGEEDTSSGAA